MTECLDLPHFRQDRHRAGKVELGNPKSLPRAVAFSPDGKMALVALWRPQDFDSVGRRRQGRRHQTRYDRRLPAYAIQVSPKGGRRRLRNQGGDTGDVDHINVVDLTGKAPRVVHALDVGQIVEAGVLQ